VFDPRAKVDWGRVGRLIDRYQLRVPIVIHDVPESELERARGLLQDTLEPLEAAGTFEHDGITFSYRSEGDGDGETVVLLHGLGGDRWQALNLLPTAPGRRIALDFRAHGDTHPVGNPDAFTFATFAEDLGAFINALGLPRVVLVGVSMGAGVAVRFALEHSERMHALVLIRPAWIERPLTRNLRPFVEIGHLLAELGAELGQRTFEESQLLHAIRSASEYAATSLTAQFAKPQAVERAPRLQRMPASTPFNTNELRQLEVPTLVIAAPEDPLHPLSYATRWANAIPQANLQTVISNALSKVEHDDAVRQVAQHYLASLPSTNRG
jgi:pimeloyl-ACP methyl ester carboxylesterase